MSLQCFPSSFCSIQLTAWEEMSFEEFQDDRYGGNLGDQNRTILAILNMSLLSSHNVLAQSDLRSGRRCRLKFQDGSHDSYLGYRNGTILAIPNLYNAPMPPIKFQLNLTYGLGEMSFEEFQHGPHGSHLG